MQMTCPKCHGDMRNYERSGVTIDQCTECRGIFLDRGELEKLFDAEANWNKQQSAPPPRPQQPPQPGAYTPPPPPGGGYAQQPGAPVHGYPPAAPAYGAPGYVAPAYGAPAYGGHAQQGYHGHYRERGHHGHYRQKRHKSFLNELFD
jgi:Zn-finger nucleic acid-binding protein